MEDIRVGIYCQVCLNAKINVFMIKQPKISIIIPVYNVEEYITECLQSVMRQTYKGAIECILVDDCGTDNSIAVAEQLIAEYERAK